MYIESVLRITVLGIILQECPVLLITIAFA
jgi:hypothetical protein